MLWDSTRWTAARAPIGKGRKALVIDNFYAAQTTNRETGTENARALRKVFRVASSRGPVPGLICLDANVPIATNASLRALMGAFGWYDAAELQRAIDGKEPEMSLPFVSTAH